MTFLAWDESFLRHDLPGHPENAGRLRAILDHVPRDPVLSALDALKSDREATDEELLAVHTRRLLLAVDHAEERAPVSLDPDTYVVHGSRRAARVAARLTILAAHRAIARHEGGIVLARPPGHHATADRSMGFCLYNNVAVAARAALAAGAADRVLIFDHDVHHGNGTQAIFESDPRVVYQSFHLWPHYPGTGAVNEIGHGAAEGNSMNAPLQRGDGEPEVRALMEDVFLPTARSFRPDLVLVSAGFDSLEGDPLGGLRLGASFFGEIIARLRSLTPRVVAVLEGGYQVDRIPHAVAAQARALEGDAFEPGLGRAPPCLRHLSEALGPHWPVLEA